MPVKVKHYDELSVKRLWDKMKERAEFMKYMPYNEEKKKLPNRQYFFNVFNTIHNKQVMDMVYNAQMNRHVGDE
jgi:hypothetical protein